MIKKLAVKCMVRLFSTSNTQAELVVHELKVKLCSFGAIVDYDIVNTKEIYSLY